MILKDNDIKYKIRLPLDTTVQLLKQIRSDAEFLYSLGIMDYSLLVGVHNTEYEVKEDTTNGNGMPRLVRASTAKVDSMRVRSVGHTPFAAPLPEDINAETPNSDDNNISYINHNTRESTETTLATDAADESQLALAKKLEVML